MNPSQNKNAHQPVLVDEILKIFNVKPNENYVDCTLGGGGHAAAILKKSSPHGKLLGIDWDKAALEIARSELKQYQARIIFVQANYANLKKLVDKYSFAPINYIICDLGFSSNQLQDSQRGFSFDHEGKLDLRYSSKNDLWADEIINTWSEPDLVKIFKDFGEERLARPLVREILEIRKSARITSPLLKDICARVYQKFYKTRSQKNPSTKIWQALRITVNSELENLMSFLPQAIEVLEPGGKLAVISFHSLEDRIVKKFFKTESKDCICPPEFPECRCDHKASIKILTKKPIKPTAAEVAANPRSASSILRIIEKI